MKIVVFSISIFALVTLALAAPKTWVLKTGEAVSGDYVSSGTAMLVILNHGTNYFIPISNLSASAQSYVAIIKKQAAEDLYYSAYFRCWTNASKVYAFAKTLAPRPMTDADARKEREAQNGDATLAGNLLCAQQLFIELANAGHVPANLLLGDFLAGVNPPEISSRVMMRFPFLWEMRICSTMTADSYLRFNDCNHHVSEERLRIINEKTFGLLQNEAALYYQVAAKKGNAEARCKLALLLSYTPTDWYSNNRFDEFKTKCVKK